MTSPPDRNRRPGSTGSSDLARYPALEAFVLGYLHQDVAVVHGDAASAMDAFIAEANPDDLVRVAAEWSAFRSAVEGRDGQRGLAAPPALGSGWLPGSWDEVVSVFDRLIGALGDLGLS
jgi:hypothetical protein